MKSDFPPCSKFVKKYKALTVSLTFFVSLNLLLLACCLYTRSDWFFISFFALLLAFCVIFIPIFLNLYPVCGPVKRHYLIICASVDLAAVIALIAICLRDGNDFSKGLCLVLFCAVPVYICVATFSYLRTNCVLNSGIACVTGGIFAFFVNAVSNALVYGKPFAFNINFFDWSEVFLQGNIIHIVSVVALAVGIVLILLGTYKLINKK